MILRSPTSSLKYFYVLSASLRDPTFFVHIPQSQLHRQQPQLIHQLINMSEHKRLPLRRGPSFELVSPTPPNRVPTPIRLAPKSLRPYVTAIMQFGHGKKFQSKTSAHRTRRLSQLSDKEGHFVAALTVFLLSYFED